MSRALAYNQEPIFFKDIHYGEIKHNKQTKSKIYYKFSVIIGANVAFIINHKNISLKYSILQGDLGLSVPIADARNGQAID